MRSGLRLILLVGVATACLAVPAPADDWTVSRDLKGHLILAGPSCARLLAQVEDLREWTKRMGEKLGDMPELQSGEDRSCKAGIDGSVPRIVEDYHGLQTPYDGPNCWNLALVTSGLLSHLRFTDSPEMTDFMQSRLCRRIPDFEGRQPGDIGAIRSNGGKGFVEVHGFVYISDDLVFSKNGMSKDESYALQTLGNVRKIYGVPSDPRCLKSDKSPVKDCSSWINYYRCQPFDQYLSLHQDKLPRELLDLIGKEDDISCDISQVALGREAPSPSLKRSLQDSVEAIGKLADQEGHDPPDPDSLFVLQNLQLRLNSLLTQLQFF